MKNTKIKKTTKKGTTKKATTKFITSLYKEQNERRQAITQQAKDYKTPLNMLIRNYFDNYLTAISYKECYDCGNGSFNYRVFIKSDKKLPKQYTNSQYINDVKTMILVNDRTGHIKCAIGLPSNDNYKAF